MKKLSIIIPVYNEEDYILKVINSVITADALGLKKEIIIIDDGSTDGTAKEIKIKIKIQNQNKKKNSCTILFIEKKKNEGKGAALKTGFKQATGDILMVQDADSEYSVKDYPALLAPFLKDNASVVYGSRNKQRENFHNRYSYFSFYIGGLLLTWYINLLYGLRLTDQPTGYKLFSNRVRSFLLIPSENRFSYEVAVTALLAINKIIFVEVPIHYKPRTMEQGKKITTMDFIKSILVGLKYKCIG